MYRKTRRRLRSLRIRHQFDHPVLFLGIDISIGLVKILFVAVVTTTVYLSLVQ